jgi:hypothetical protein
MKRGKTMKRALSLVLCILLTAVLAIPSFAIPASEKVVTVPYIDNGIIKIDAVKDDIYSKAAVIELNEQNLAYFAGSPESTKGIAYAFYSDTAFYFYVEVTDPNIDYSNETPEQTWNRDSIGIMLDFDYNRSEDYLYSYQDNGDMVGYVNLSGDGVQVNYHTYLDLDVRCATNKQTADGKIIYEVMAPISKKGLKAGDKIGLEVLAVNAEGGTRVGCVSWSVDGSEMWHYSQVTGTAILGEKTVEAAPAVIEDDASAAAEDNASANPETSDASILFYSLCLIAVAAGFVAVKKKMINK